MISKNDDSSNCMDHRAPAEPAIISPSPSLIYRKMMKLFQDGECLTVFDYTRENAFLFSQGDWSMIRRDLELAGVDASCIETLENGFCREIIRAFRVRKELVHYKKVCLHLFEEAKQMEREFKQIMSFFFWNDGDEKEKGMKTQLEAIQVLMPSDVDDGNPSEIETVQLAITRHETGECTLLDRKLLYMMSCGAWMYHIGLQKGIHDSRDLAKAICMSPRHPDGEENDERPIKLQQLPLSMQVYKSLLSFREELPQTSESSVRCDIEQHTMKGTSGAKGLEDILYSVHSKLQWHKNVVDFLRCSICARGGFKALAMIEELELYKTHLLELQSLVQETLKSFQLIHAETIDNMNIKSLNEKEVSNELKSAVERLHIIHFLRGASRACEENLKWITTILSLGLQNSSLYGSNHSRLFVASDDICRFVPNDFEFGSLIGKSRKALDTIFIPCMKASVLHESWPPSMESNRTRIVAFDKYTANEQMLESRAVNMKRFMRCEDCEGLYDNKWVRHNLCSFCEMKRKEQHTGSYCLFQDCKGGKMNSSTYCPHADRCFYCDAPYSCEKFCRLSRGGGDLAIELVESIQPGLVLLDFDRTFCSTKSGASPLPKGKKAKDRFTHSIDHDLRVVVSSNVESAHIITRNSHQKEIQEFLRMNDLPGLANRVHVVPKKVSKGSYINEIFSDELKIQSCLFIDDDLRELTNDPWLCQHKNIHRLLFIRTMSNSNVQ
jgi:hypothetical protein